MFTTSDFALKSLIERSGVVSDYRGGLLAFDVLAGQLGGFLGFLLVVFASFLLRLVIPLLEGDVSLFS